MKSDTTIADEERAQSGSMDDKGPANESPDTGPDNDTDVNGDDSNWMHHITEDLTPEELKQLHEHIKKKLADDNDADDEPMTMESFEGDTDNDGK